jgi:hypothetical protein
MAVRNEHRRFRRDVGKMPDMEYVRKHRFKVTRGAVARRRKKMRVTRDEK